MQLCWVGGGDLPVSVPAAVVTGRRDGVISVLCHGLYGGVSRSINSCREKVLRRSGSLSLTTLSIRFRFFWMMAAIFFSSRVFSVISRGL
ncbi:MAG: hypothetical protein R6X27_00365 [Candidatus Desulfacyla sp.]